MFEFEFEFEILLPYVIPYVETGEWVMLYNFSTS
jgi:hypothetical protein